MSTLNREFLRGDAIIFATPAIMLTKRKSYLLGELAFLVASLGLLLWQHRQNLIDVTHTFVGDTHVWGYPAFHFFATTLASGELPLWNPFAHGGEPFYPILLQRRLLEPFTWGFVLVGKNFTRNPTALFNWHLILLSLIMAAGTYLVLRPIAVRLRTRLALILILLFSSYLLVSFRQIGCISQFLWLPWICFFLLRVFYDGDGRWHNWIWLALFLGLNQQSYWFTGPAFFLLLFFTWMILFERERLRSWAALPGLRWKLGTLSLVLIAMALPNLVVYAKQSSFIYPLRMTDETLSAKGPTQSPLQWEGGPANIRPPLRMDYDLVYQTGTPSTLWDFIQIASPTGNSHGPKGQPWGKPTECFIYLGLFPWLLALIGLFCAPHALKPLFALFLGATALFMLGKPGGLHPVLYYLYPPLWYLRHTITFVVPLTFALMYFFVIGMEHLIDALESRGPRLRLSSKAIFASIYSGALLYAVLVKLAILATKPDYPLLSFLIPIVIGATLLRHWVSGVGLVIAIALAHFLTVLHFIPDKRFYLSYAGWALLLPCVACWLAFKTQRVSRFAMAVVCLLAIGLDLNWTRENLSLLYRAQPDPLALLGIPKDLSVPRVLQKRKSTSPLPLLSDQASSQGMRYLSHVEKYPHVFSSPYFERPTERPKVSFGASLRRRRWNSYFLTKDYFSLIHSELSPVVLSKLFAVDESPIQFKSSAMRSTPKEWLDRLAALPDGQAAAVLDRCLFLEEAFPAASASADCLSPTSVQGTTDFTYEVKSVRYNQLRLATVAAQDGLLTWVEGYHPDWKVWLDRLETKLFKANAGFKAVWLPKGEHEVVFEFRPLAVIAAMGIFLGTSLVCIVVGLLLSLRSLDVFVRSTRR